MNLPHTSEGKILLRLDYKIPSLNRILSMSLKRRFREKKIAQEAVASALRLKASE